MIKLVNLLAETRQDSIAREITADVIKSLKKLKKDAIEDPKKFEDDFNLYDGFKEVSFDNKYTFPMKEGSKDIAVNAVVVLKDDKSFKKPDYYTGTPSKKTTARGYDVRGNVNSHADGGMQLVLILNRSTFDNLEPKLSEIYTAVLAVARHELEHVFQTAKSFKTSGREQDLSRKVDPSFSKRKGSKHYRLLPSEMEADAKAINLLKKKKRIPFEQAATDYYSGIPQVHKSDVGSLVKTITQYAKRFNFG